MSYREKCNQLLSPVVEICSKTFGNNQSACYDKEYLLGTFCESYLESYGEGAVKIIRDVNIQAVHLGHKPVEFSDALIIDETEKAIFIVSVNSIDGDDGVRAFASHVAGIYHHRDGLCHFTGKVFGRNLHDYDVYCLSIADIRSFTSESPEDIGNRSYHEVTTGCGCLFWLYGGEYSCDIKVSHNRVVWIWATQFFDRESYNAYLNQMSEFYPCRVKETDRNQWPRTRQYDGDRNYYEELLARDFWFDVAKNQGILYKVNSRIPPETYEK